MHYCHLSRDMSTVACRLLLSFMIETAVIRTMATSSCHSYLRRSGSLHRWWTVHVISGGHKARHRRILPTMFALPGLLWCVSVRFPLLVESPMSVLGLWHRPAREAILAEALGDGRGMIVSLRSHPTSGLILPVPVLISHVMCPNTAGPFH